MMSPVRLIAALLLALAPVAGCGPISAKAPSAIAATGSVPLEISTAKGVLRYTVEVARTEQEQERGLMYRTSLPDKGGMIFPMKPPRFASFWMKNTLIPLDIIFIRADGHIARIAANAVPESLATIDSGEPVAAVLELAGGAAATAGISADDVVRWADSPAP